VLWVPEIGRLFLFNNICGFFNDAVVLFSRNEVKLGLWMLSFRSLLTFCDSTYWPLAIDVYTHYLIEDNCINTLFMNWRRMFLLGVLSNEYIHLLPTANTCCHKRSINFWTITSIERMLHHYGKIKPSHQWIIHKHS